MDESVDIRFIMNSPEVEKEADRVKSSISGIEKTAESTNKAISNAFNEEILNTENIAEKVNIQKRVLKDLERAYESARKKAGEMAPGQAKMTALSELTAAKKEIQEEKIVLEELVRVQEQHKQQNRTITTQISNKKEELLKLTEGTEEYSRVLRELGDLETRRDDVNRQGRIFRNDERGFKATTEAIQGMSGAMSTAVGVASLLGASEENLTKIQTRLQAVMAISVGVNQVAQVLNKDSYFSHLILGKAKNMLTVATTRLTVALGISNVAAKALMATFTLGLSVAIGVVITMMSKWQSKREEQRRQEEEARKEQEKYYTAIADNVAKSLAEYRKLQGMWKTLNGDSKKQQKFLKDHADKFKELGTKVTSVKDAENLLVKNETKFIQSLMNRARAAASMELAMEKYKIAAEKAAELEEGNFTEDDMKQARKNVASREFDYAAGEWKNLDLARDQTKLQALYEEEAKAISAARLQAVIDKAQSDADKQIVNSLKNGKTADELLAEAGITPTTDGDKPQADAMKKYGEAVLKSMADLEKSRIALLKEGKAKELRELKLRRDETLAQIKKDQKDLAEAYKAAGRGELTDKDKEGFAEREQNANQEYDQDQEEINKKYEKNLAGVYRDLSDVFLTEEERKRAEIKRTYDEWRERAKKMFEGGDLNALQYADLIVRIKKAEDYERVKDLVEEFRSYEEQRLQIAKEYDDKIAALEEQNINGQYDNAIAEAKKQRDRAIVELDLAMNKQAGAWNRLFADASKLSSRSIKEIIADTKKLLDYLNGVSDVKPIGFTEEQLNVLRESPDQIKTLYDALISKQNELDSRNQYAFSSIERGIKKIKESSKIASDALEELDEKKRAALELEADAARHEGIQYMKEGAVELTAWLSSAAEKLKELAEASGDTRLADFADQMNAFGQNLQAAAQGASSGGWIGAIVGGVTDMISQTINASISAKAYIEEVKQSMRDFYRELNMLELSRMVGDNKNAFGQGEFTTLVENIGMAKEAMRQYEEELTKKTIPEIEKGYNNLGVAVFGFGVSGFGGELFGFGKSVSNETKTLLAAYEKGYSDLEAMAIRTEKKSGWSKFWGGKDKYKSLKDLAPELWKDGQFDTEAAEAFLATNKQLSDEQRAQIQNVIDLKATYEEAMQMLRDEISDTFGVLGSSLGDVIVDAFKNGTDAMEEWKKSFDTVLENLGKKLMQTLFFQDYFDDLQEDLEAVYGELGSDPDEMGRQVQVILGNFFSSMEGAVDAAEDWYKQWVEQAERRGFNLEGDSKTSGVSGQLQDQMTEGTASQLVGLWNITAMEIRQVRELTIGQLAISGEIRDHVGALLVQMILIERNTRETADNTAETVKRLEAMTDKLTDIEKNTKPSNSRM